MNYIPGFSNYLETTAPRYARGGPARFVEEDIYGGGYDGSPLMYSDPMAAAAPSMDAYQQAAVAPMATEAVSPAVSPAASSAATTPATTTSAGAVAPYDLSALAGLDLSGLYGMNFGSNFGGGPMGGQYQTDPNLQYVSAPLSNKGNATSQTGGNTFAVRVDQPVRLFDHRTNQVIFEGTGFDAARKATELGQNLSNTQGRKANYSIQTADPAGNYSTVAYEKKNKSTLGQIGNVVGTLAPLALMAIPGFGQLGLAAQIAAGAGAGGVGAALKGDNILKGIAMGGLSAAGGQILGGPLSKIGASNIGLRAGTAIGTGIGSTAGGLVTGQSLKNSLLGGVASGALSYMSPDITKALSGGAPASSSTSGGGGGYDGILVNATPAVTPISLNTSLGGSPNKIQQALAETPYDGLTVSGNRVGSTFSVNTGSDRFGTPGKGEVSLKELNPEDIVVDATRTTSVAAPVTGPLTTTAPAVQPNDIVVDATTKTTPVSVTDPGLAKRLADMENYAEKPLIEVTGNKTERPTPVAVSVVPPVGSVTDTLPLPKPDPALTDKDKLGVEDYLRLAGLATGLLGNLGGGGGKGSGSSGTYIPGGAGSGRLNPIFSAQLPAAGALGTVGATRTARPLGDVDWLTYGQRPELKFFDYATQPANPAPVTSPLPGNPAGPIMAEDKIRHSEEGIPLWMQLGLPNPNAPATQAAGQIMEERDPMAMAEGGAFAAKRGGRSQRTEFAVNGPGTGRSDDIPAVLSDGEYVIDAETVALLGDGSSKAGAKKLDDLRVKVRKHKGQKLAKGRFSANAKKPEAYLSGGRI